MNNIWFLYFDGGYERDEVLFAVPGETTAKQCQEKMTSFAQRAIARLPIEPAFSHTEVMNNNSEWNRWHDKHQAAVAKIRWPYGINMLYQHTVSVGSMPLKVKA